ncbi:MAG: rpoN [Rhodoferax sp.]|nr:rpoN [Rhodoferax sp.]
MFQEPSLRLNARQGLMLTPRLQHAVRLLQLSSLDYAQELAELVARNPFLETDDYATTVPVAATALNSQAAPPALPGLADLAQPAPTALETDPVGRLAADAADDRQHDVDESLLWREAGDGGPLGSGHGDAGGDFQAEAQDYTAGEVQLREHLRSQASLLPLSTRDAALVGAVIESIDDDGYLRLPLAELGPLADVAPPADECELRTALKLVQSFEPVGVGARDISECLLLQLEQLALPQRALAERIITEHLEGLAQRDTVGIARRLGVLRVEVEAASSAIRRLDPRPGWRFSHSDTHFVTPDVLVHKVRNQWVASLNSGVVPRLKLNQQIAELFRQHRGGTPGSHTELASHLQEARWTLRNVEQRFSTILEVAQAIVRRQQSFFEHGPLAMKPLALRQIAEEVGVHESTVCRVTNNKYMATSVGTLELKYFFSRPMPMGNAYVASGTAIRAVVQEMIAAENPAHPLSDVEIAEQLARQGMNVARRTVTKYRQALKLPPVDRRRLLAMGT